MSLLWVLDNFKYLESLGFVSIRCFLLVDIGFINYKGQIYYIPSKIKDS